jgi:N-acetylneuraminic acid mutarotase
MNKFTIHSLVLTISCILISACKKDDTVKLPDNSNQLKWEATTPFPGYIRKSAAGFWIGDNFYTGFGFGYLDNNFQELDNLKDFYEYNSVTKIWTKKSDFPDIGRYSVAAFSSGNKGYIGFGESLVCNPGCNQINYKDLWEYDPSLDSWTKIGTYDQIADGATKYSKSYDINGKVYITFGYDLWVFNSSDKSLAKIGPVPEYMIITSGFEINGKIYMGTGGTPDMQKIFYEFNPSTSNWTKKADFPGQARRFASGFALNGKGYLTCGEGTMQTGTNSFQIVGLKDTWQYDPVTNVWTKFNEYPGQAFVEQVSSNSSSKAIVGTGETMININYGKDFWIIQ